MGALRLDVEVVTSAVEQEGMALQFATVADHVSGAFQRLGPDWSQNIDPASGRTFYYNCRSGQSRWDCPAPEQPEAPAPASPLPYSPQADPVVVRAAVKQAGCALAYASLSLQADRDIVLSAIGSDPRALQFASSKLRGDRNVVKLAV